MDVYNKRRPRETVVLKMMRSWLVLAAVFSACAATGNQELLRSVQGMQGLTITCDTQEKLSIVSSYEGHPDFDFLRITKVLGDEVKVLVAAKSLTHFKTVLWINEIPFETFVENLEDKFRDEYLMNELARKVALRSKGPSLKPFKFYPRFREIEVYLQELAQTYNNTVTLLNIGSSYEGNPIYVVKISSGGSNKPAVLIDAGIHAREWIAPTTALWAIHELAVNKNNSDLYANVDWYILPSLNPDGYEFTHTGYRLWRKTRSVNPGYDCYGTDANRNFELEWMTVGASDYACSDTYAGNKPFSEKETASLRDFVLANNKSIKAYLTLHSYGQYMLHPWGYTSALPGNEPTLRSVAVKAEKALAAIRGTRYAIGSSTNVLYAAAGGSDDWVMGVGGVPLSYTVELPGGGIYGFNPPASQIEPVGVETFEAFKVFGKYVASTYA